jgi:hypothetical protein
MLNAVKHPKGTGFFVSLRMTGIPEIPKEPLNDSLFVRSVRKRKEAKK